MIKSLIRQIKIHPLGSCFLIFGYIICILSFSLGVNYYIHTKESDADYYNGYKERNSKVIINFFDTVDFARIQSALEELSKEVEVQVHMHPYNFNSIRTASLRIISYEEKPEWIVPLLSGRYISSKEVKVGEKVAVIGEGLREYTTVIGNDSYISVNGENYKVVGIAGRKTNKLSFENVLYIPLKTTPSSVVDNIKKNSQMAVFIRKNNGSPADAVSRLTEAIKEIDELSIIKEESIDESFGLTGIKLRNTFIMVGIILCTGIINVLNLSFFWILDRKKEISVKKAFGGSNYIIIFEVFKDMFFLSFAGAIFAVALQFIIDKSMSERILFSITPNVVNLIYVLAMSLLCGVLITSTLLKKIVNIQPAEALKQ